MFFFLYHIYLLVFFDLQPPNIRLRHISQDEAEELLRTLNPNYGMAQQVGLLGIVGGGGFKYFPHLPVPHLFGSGLVT